MYFRPCIDIHNGKVKQLVGGSLRDNGNLAEENFVAEQDAAFYARLYKQSRIVGGHIILLNQAGSEYYEQDRQQAELALTEYPGGLQIGGGITPENAKPFLDMGASHVIVTSYVFREGRVDYERLRKLLDTVGKKHLVLDLSCRKRDGKYYIVTDRWQRFTEEIISEETLAKLREYADEFLIHAVDVEGKAKGVETELVELLAEYADIPTTYAGGVGSYHDIEIIRELGKGKLDITIGSALDIFGGSLDYDKVIRMMDGHSENHLDRY
ncbi:MAG: phosphoribosylformimino-5-aminoimidazole carboxamide ribotide isomerase [Clostridium sp.]|nr:phosphoribosylformimino-5-aminoimidazole carboxamide ribotide isomerase [Clostridium sp.]